MLMSDVPGVFLVLRALCLTTIVYGVPMTSPPEVRTSLGVIRGYWQSSVSGKPVRKFVGIPYAVPPLGPRRFRPPEPIVQGWEGVLNATEYGVSCMQKKVPIVSKHPFLVKFFGRAQHHVSEDCLTINIHAPRDTSKTYPVMFWIYGGGFSRGTTANEAYEGTQLAAEQDVVVVTFNYRMNVFGFLYVGHPEAPGNMGLMDQAMAMKWTRENIAAFGGDPDKVTVFGQSAGASSIGYHLILPGSQPLFQRAIMESGSPTSVFAIERRKVVLERARELLKEIGCPHNLDTDAGKTAAVDCLRGKDPFEILDAEMVFGYDFVYVFRPIVDGVYLKDHPATLLANPKNVKKLDIMTGTVRDEGTIFLANLFPFEYQLRDGLKPSIVATTEGLKDDFGIANMTVDVIMGLYFKDHESNVLQGTAKMVADAIFMCPCQDVERGVYAAGGNVYKYNFLYATKKSYFPKWFGAHHGIEVLYVFGNPLIAEDEFTPEEKRFSLDIMRQWANFARTGSPNTNSDGTNSTTTWPKYTAKNEEYMVLSPNSTSVGRHLRSKYCKFWNDIIPKLSKIEKTKRTGYMEIYRSGE